MNQDTWSQVDHYITDVFGLTDDILESTQKACDDAGLPSIAVSVPKGNFIYQLARIRGARQILEIGTLGGYSTIWMARALPADGKLITLEIDKKHADVACENITRAGFADRVEVRLGAAIEELPKLAKENQAFDLVFIDADKPSIPDYFTWSLKMSRPGTVIVVDNVVREGAVVDSVSEDPAVRGVRRLNDMLARDKRVTSTTLQTVGTKGYDGFTVILVDSL